MTKKRKTKPLKSLAKAVSKELSLKNVLKPSKTNLVEEHRSGQIKDMRGKK